MEKAHNRLNIVIIDGAKETPFGSLFSMEEPSYAPIKAVPGFTVFMPSHPNRINTSETFTRDFLSLADKKGLSIETLRGELSHLRQSNKQPQPQITIAKELFFFNLPDRLPVKKKKNLAENKNSKPLEQTDIQVHEEKVQQKQQTSEVGEKTAVDEKTPMQSEDTTEVSKNDVNITLSSPGSVTKEAPQKPKEGEERQILLQ